MNKVKPRFLVTRFLLGAATGTLLLIIGLDILSWKYWLTVAWLFLHLLIWSYLDNLERKENDTRS